MPKETAYSKWVKAAPVLKSLGMYCPLPYVTVIKYSVWPAHKFFPLWAFQHQKALRDFVRITGGNEWEESEVTDAANYLWHKDPKTVEKNLN